MYFFFRFVSRFEKKKNKHLNFLLPNDDLTIWCRSAEHLLFRASSACGVLHKVDSCVLQETHANLEMTETALTRAERQIQEFFAGLQLAGRPMGCNAYFASLIW